MTLPSLPEIVRSPPANLPTCPSMILSPASRKSTDTCLTFLLRKILPLMRLPCSLFFERAFKANNAWQSVTTFLQLTQHYSEREEVDQPNKKNAKQSRNKKQKNQGRDSFQKNKHDHRGKKWCHFHKSYKHDWSECSKNPYRQPSDESSKRKALLLTFSRPLLPNTQSNQSLRVSSQRRIASNQSFWQCDSTIFQKYGQNQQFSQWRRFLSFGRDDAVSRWRKCHKIHPRHLRLRTWNDYHYSYFSLQKNKRVHWVLLDTGTSVSLIWQSIAPADSKLTSVPRGATKWQMRGGTFTTNMVCSIPFQLPEFTPNRTIVHSFRVDATIKQRESDYDVIMGRNMLRKLGLTCRVMFCEYVVTVWPLFCCGLSGSFDNHALPGLDLFSLLLLHFIFNSFLHYSWDGWEWLEMANHWQ